MDISDVLSRVVILTFPGIICNLLYGILKNRDTRKDWEDFLQILVFSVTSYLIYAFILSVRNFFIGNRFSFDFSPLNVFLDPDPTINWLQIVYISLFGVVLAFIASYFYKNRWITRFGFWIRVTRKHSDEDVWADFFEVADTKWVLVRDHKQNLTYYGWVQHYSMSEKEREIMLGEVSIHKGATGEPGDTIYCRDSIYLSREKYDLTIEMIGDYKNADDKTIVMEDLNMSDEKNEIVHLVTPKDEHDELAAKGSKPVHPKPLLKSPQKIQQTKDKEKKEDSDKS